MEAYITIGLWVALACSAVIIAPLLYYLFLLAVEFVNDGEECRYVIHSKVEDKFWVFSNDVAGHTALGVVGVTISVVFWPLVIAAGALWGVLLWLRMGSRLKRHMKDKDIHRG